MIAGCFNLLLTNLKGEILVKKTKVKEKDNMVKLYEVNVDAICLKCKCKGAVKLYGRYYPEGIGDLADEVRGFEEVRNSSYMDYTVNFSGENAYKCLNCKNVGLIDSNDSERYKKGFKTIKESGKQLKGRSVKNEEKFNTIG